MPRRRFTTLVFVAAVVVALVFTWSSSTREIASSAVEAVIPAESVRDKLAGLPGLPTLAALEVPDLKITWHKSIHKPPEQSNSTRGDSKWYSDWKWLNPFSSSVTLDEERAVLPPLAERRPVYTYYDTTVKRDGETAEADKQQLLIWRRAWWAQGFKPIVLTEAEAVSHPSYPTLKRQGIRAELEYEFMRWLAWAHMGTGLLASWRCVPMGAYDDATLAHLRRGEFEQLTRFDGLANGLFAGAKTQIEEAMKFPLADVKLGTHKTLVDAIGPDKFQVEKPSGLAYYDDKTISSKYAALATALKDKPAKGRKALNGLMDAHLHTTWQNMFPSGINVLKPLPAHSTSLVKPAVDLAGLLAECPASILQSSCPPNRPRCVPCIGSKMRLSQSEEFHNGSKMFTISVVPHPYTMITLNNLTSDVSVRHIRRDTERDGWVTAVTRSVLGDGRGGPSRVVSVKDMVASPWSSWRSIWFATEQFPVDFSRPPPPEKAPSNEARPARETIHPFPDAWLADLSWQFGFSIPQTAVWHGESLPPVPGPERWAKEPAGLPAEGPPKSSTPRPATAEELALELELLRNAREKVKSRDRQVVRMRRVAEAWNMADTEAWKFVRAYRARAEVERELFEEEERRYAGTQGGRSKGGWW
ncbi:hypothetical protein DV736_g1140, partial [Chaetothyriales sp. CBS 134916]